MAGTWLPFKITKYRAPSNKNTPYIITPSLGFLQFKASVNETVQGIFWERSEGEGASINQCTQKSMASPPFSFIRIKPFMFGFIIKMDDGRKRWTNMEWDWNTWRALSKVEQTTPAHKTKQVSHRQHKYIYI